MPNLEKKISNHNHKTLQNSNKKTDDDKMLSSCILKSNCRVNLKCLTEESYIKPQSYTKIKKKST